MKVLLKILAVVAAAVCVMMFVFGMFGYDTRYGEITTTVIRGADDLVASGDFADTTTVSFKAADDATLTDEELEAVAASFEQRMSYFSVLADYRVAVDYAERTVWVTVPSSEYSESVMNYLVLDMGFEAHTGTEQTENTLIFDESGISRVTPHYETSTTGYSYYTVEIALTKEAREKYIETTKSLAEESQASGSVQYVSFWFNDSMVESRAVNEAYSGGSVLLTSSSLSATTVDQMTILLNCEPLPATMTYGQTYESPARLGENIQSVLWIAAAAVFGAVALWFIIKYRVSGFIAALCMLGTAGGVMAVLSGFYSATPTPFTLAALAGGIAVIFMGLECSLRDCEAVRNAFPSKSGSPVASALRGTIGGSAVGYAVALVIGLALTLLTRQNGLLFNWVSGAMKAAQIGTLDITEFGTFGAVLLFGTLISVCFNIAGERLMLLAASDCAGLKKASLYGGKGE